MEKDSYGMRTEVGALRELCLVGVGIGGAVVWWCRRCGQRED